MVVQAVAAIIAAVAAVASTAVQAGAAAVAANQDSGFSSTSAGEQAMLALQKMKAVDLSRMGGMSPGQYNRYLMGGEVQGIQAQNFANTISQNPFLDAMKKEAYTRMTISSIIAENQKRVAQLTDIDAETAAKNALASAEIAGQASKTESDIIDRQNKIKEIEMLQEQQMWSNFAKLAGSAAKTVGQFVKAGDELGWFDKAKTTPKAITGTNQGIAPAPASLPSVQREVENPSVESPVNTNAFYQPSPRNPVDVLRDISPSDPGFTSALNQYFIGSPNMPSEFSGFFN